jgi:CRP/FNR family transcriptional regulator, cyclic AMP receptor protein
MYDRVFSSDGMIAELFLCSAARGTLRSMKSAMHLHEPATPANDVYFIQSGQVRIYQPGPEGTGRLLEILGEGDWFGAEAVAGQCTYGTSAVAVGETQVIEMPAQRLLEVATQHPEAARELIRQMACKLQAARDDAARLVFDDCNTRLLQTLVRFSRTVAAVPNGDGVTLQITHHQLAQAVGVARETVSLALTQLRQRKLLRTGRNRLAFDPEVLRQLVQSPQAAQAMRPPDLEKVA